MTLFVVELNIRKNWCIVLYSKEKKDKEEKREINRYWEIKKYIYEDISK